MTWRPVIIGIVLDEFQIDAGFFNISRKNEKHLEEYRTEENNAREEYIKLIKI